MNLIASVDELVDTLVQTQSRDYVAIAQMLDIPEEDLMEYAFWKEKGYTRNCIERTENFELLLLCWNPGDSTPIHCHGEQRCWVYQVNGEMKEVLYSENSDDELVKNKERILASGDIGYMDDSIGYHTLHNISDKKCMSLHLYAKPINTCTYYSKKKEAFVPKEMRYYSYKGELVDHPKRKSKSDAIQRRIKQK
ncbi:MAG: cysteine dioxygenase family protein [Marinirhabdus sp.]|nr:cysteine dioxygenase family protein [Marinirhabdus sp.]